MTLWNVTQAMALAEKVRVAERPWTRARGMIGRAFDGFDALILPHCRSVHTCFMGQALDLIFVDETKSVLETRTGVRPWRMVFGPRRCRSVIELPAGRLCGIALRQGDQLSW